MNHNLSKINLVQNKRGHQADPEPIRADPSVPIRSDPISADPV